MIRFALIAASTLGFFLTAALGNLMVPLLRAFQGRWDEPKARQAPSPKQEAPDAEPERPPHFPFFLLPLISHELLHALRFY